MQNHGWIEEELKVPAARQYARRLATMKNGLSRQMYKTLASMVEEIRRLKREKNAVILSHYYMPAYLQITEADGGVADYVGDSLGLSLEATRVQADHIVFCGVQFMAETAYIINPQKTVLLPDRDAGCSLASSISGEQVRSLREQYPGVPVIAYINTYAETKAEVDICVTSRNAEKIMSSFREKDLLFVPDKYMGQNLADRFAKETGKNIIQWDGACEVHEQFRDNLPHLYDAYPEAEMLLHWEVPGETVSSAFSRNRGVLGSTSDIISYVGNSPARQFILASECDLGASLKGRYPNKEFITPCVVCHYMKKINMNNTLEALRSIGTSGEEQFTIKLDPEVRERAYLPIRRMLDLS